MKKASTRYLRSYALETCCLQSLTLAGRIFRHASDGRPVLRPTLYFEGRRFHQHICAIRRTSRDEMIEERRHEWRVTERASTCVTLTMVFLQSGHKVFTARSLEIEHTCLRKSYIHTACNFFLSLNPYTSHDRTMIYYIVPNCS